MKIPDSKSPDHEEDVMPASVTESMFTTVLRKNAVPKSDAVLGAAVLNKSTHVSRTGTVPKTGASTDPGPDSLLGSNLVPESVVPTGPISNELLRPPGEPPPADVAPHTETVSTRSFTSPETHTRTPSNSANSRISSSVNITIFTPKSAVSSHSLFLVGSSRSSSADTLTGAVIPHTPPLQPLTRNLLILHQNFASAALSKAGENQTKYTPSGEITPQSYDGRLSPTFITLPSSGSIIHPFNGWITKDLSQESSGMVPMPRMNRALGQTTSALLLSGIGFNRVVPSSMPSVDTASLNGFLHTPTRFRKSGSSSEPDGGLGVSVVGVSSSRADLVAEDDEEGGDCGWLCLQPRFLQKARTAKWVLFWLCWAAAAQGMVVNGFVNVCITTIEKRFDLRSTDTGLIAGAYDMASVLCSIPVSYLGSRSGSSKPRWLGWGVFIMGVGSFFFTIPHFSSPAYKPNRSTDTASVLKCLRDGSRDSRCEVVVGNWLSSFRHIFVLGQFLHGVGASPLYTLGVTYLDESVPSKMSSLYLGIFYAMAVVGPALGYVLGGQFLKVYIDAPSTQPSSYGLTANSDLWLGGWWIGFLVSGSLSILLSWPIMAFPSQLPGAKAIKADRVSEAHSSGGAAAVGSGSFGRLKDLPNAARVLILNPTFVALSIAGATEGVLLTGFATFMPKILENQFNMTASRAALIVGFVVVPAGGGGTLLGGWVIKKFQLTCSGILKLCIIGSFICLLSCFTFVTSCPNIDFAGVNVDYANKSATLSSHNLISDCNIDCGCQDVPYDPICGKNNVMYFSPCHAGCTSMETGQDGLKIFTGCKCVAEKGTSALHSTPAGDQRNAPDSALQEKCPSDCSLVAIFLAIFFVTMLLTFLISLPALAGTLRCVPDTHRSFALGLQWIVVRLLGTIPGPILFGALIDNTCTLWQSTCGKEGTCRSYNNYYMSRYMMGISIIFKCLSTILFFLAWWLYVPPQGSQDTPPPNSLPEGTTASSTSPASTNSKDPKYLQGIDNPAAELS